MKTTAQLITKKLRKLDKERYILECALKIVNKEPGYLKEIDALKHSIDELMKKNAHLTMENERLRNDAYKRPEPLFIKHTLYFDDIKQKYLCDMCSFSCSIESAKEGIQCPFNGQPPKPNTVTIDGISYKTFNPQFDSHTEDTP